MLLTDDPENDDFWVLENWQMLPFPNARDHICHVKKEEQRKSHSFNTDDNSDLTIVRL